MRSEHFETYQLGQRWWAVSRQVPAYPEPTSGATEAEALLAMCEELRDRFEAERDEWRWGEP